MIGEGRAIVDPFEPYFAQSGSVEWYTPSYIIAAVVAVLGEIDCDPCSNPFPFNVPARVHYTAADDGLAHPWIGTVFMNPPYGEGIGFWIVKLLAEYVLGRCTAGIALVPNGTDTEWFQDCWGAAALCFVRGRISFIGAGKNGNTRGSVLAYWGPDPARFAEVFSTYGRIIHPTAPPRAAYQLSLALTT